MFRYLLFSFFLQIAGSCISPYMQIMLRNKGYSQSVVGMLIAMGQVASIVLPLLIGAVIDKNNKFKQTLLMCLLISVLSFAMLFFDLPFSIVVIIYICAFGFSQCYNPTGDGYLNKELDGDPGAYAIVRATGTFGYVLALVFFALIKFPNPANNNQILLNIIIFSFVFGVTVFIAPKPTEKKATEKKLYSNIFDFKWFDKSFYVFMLIVGISKIAMGIVDLMLGSYMTEEMHLGNYFTIFVAFGAFCEFVMFLVVGPLLKKGKLSIWFVQMSSLIGLFLRFVIYATTDSLLMFIVAQSLHSFAFGCSHLSSTYFISKTVPKEHTSLAMSFYWSVAINFPNMIGVLSSGFIIDHLGYKTMFMLYSLIPIISMVFCIFYKKLINSRLT